MIKTAFQLKTIGSLLKERRTERNLTLKEISEIIKIRTEYLKALEDGRYHVFPSEVYIKGFLKNYAKFLGIGAERALAMYRRESEYRQKSPTIGMIAKIKERGFYFNLTPNRIILAVIIGAILITLFYVGSYVGQVFAKPRLTLVSPVAVSAEQSEGNYNTLADTVLIEGNVEVGSKLKINGQELRLNNFEKFSQEFKLEEGVNKFLLQAESQFGRVSLITLTVVKEGTTTTVTPTPIIEPSATPQPTTQLIKAKIQIKNRDAYVETTVDNGRKISKTYRVGSVTEFTATSKFEFFTARPDAVVLTINNVQQTTGTQRVTWVVENGQVVRK